MADEPKPVVTDRMRQVLDGIVAGKKNHEIAAELGLSEKTIEKFRAQLFTAFSVDNAVSLVVKAIKAGMVRV